MQTRGAGPSLFIGGVHLAVLWAFAFQRTLFELLGDNPEFFIARGNTRADIVAYAVAFTLIPPLMMLAVETLVRLVNRPVYRALHLILVGSLGAAFFLQVLKQLAAGPAGVLIAAALGLGTMLAVAYGRTAFTPQALSVLSPAPVLFLAIFLLFSPVKDLVLPAGEARAAAKVEAKAPVVVLFFDELPTSTLLNPRGGIDARRFPNFAELARHSTWYRNATTVADKTPRAVPAMLTSHNPGYEKLPIASEQPLSLFSLLGSSYRVDAIETATRLCPSAVCHGSRADSVPFRERFGDLVSDLRVVSEHQLLPDSIGRTLPPVSQTFEGFGRALGEPEGHDRVGAAQEQYSRKLAASQRVPGAKAKMFGEFLRGIDGGSSRLNFLDVQLPHYPWEYTESGQAYPAHFPDPDNFAIEDPPGRFIDNEWLVDQSYSRHMLQAGAADRLLGQLISRMKRKGIWNDAVLLVSADHGVSFRAAGLRREVTEENLTDIAFVPLFVRRPGREGPRVIDRHACTTDIPALIASALDLGVPWRQDHCSADQISVFNDFGGVQTEVLAQGIADRRTAVRRKFDIFGQNWSSVYEFGHPSGLLRRRAAPLADPVRRNVVRLDSASDIAAVDPEGPVVPSMLMGQLAQTKAPASGLPLAVALNGRIAAVTRAFALRGRTRFAAMVPARAFRAGRNTVEVFTIAGSARRPRLSSLGGVNTDEQL